MIVAFELILLFLLKESKRIESCSDYWTPSEKDFFKEIMNSENLFVTFVERSGSDDYTIDVWDGDVNKSVLRLLQEKRHASMVCSWTFFHCFLL